MLPYLLACQLVAYATRRGVDAVIVSDTCHVAIATGSGLTWIPCRRLSDVVAIAGGAETTERAAVLSAFGGDA